MDTERLYRVTRQELPRLEQILNRCFAADPLYQTLIPDPAVRRRLMPELFHCDMDEMFGTCEVFADTPELHGLIVLSDKTEKRNLIQYYLTELWAQLETDAYLLREDPSMQTFHNFMKGEDYLNSSWTGELGEVPRLHIIYLAVSAEFQHHGIAAALMNEVLRQADAGNMMVSLETHNDRNLPFYRHFGFQLYRKLNYGEFPLAQYCLVRPQQGEDKMPQSDRYDNHHMFYPGTTGKSI